MNAGIDVGADVGARDRVLARALVERDEQALRKVYELHARACLTRARQVLADHTLAEDVVQEVFMRFWRDPGRFDPERGSMRSWLYTQVRCRSIDLLRAEAARRAREQRHAYRHTGDDAFDRAVGELAERETVRAAIAELSDDMRTAIELAFSWGHTYREVAVLLNEPEGTIKSRIRSARLRLHAALVDADVA